MKIVKYVAASVAALVGVSLVVLLVMGRREDAGRVVAAIDIERSPEQVFRYVREPEMVKRWVSWLVDIQSTGEGVGAKDTWVMEDPNMGGEKVIIHAVFTEWEPPRKMKVQMESPIGFSGVQEYRLVPLGPNRTRFEIDAKYEYEGWMTRLMEPLVTPQARKKLNQDLQRLKKLAES
jgi:uncharacterized protein YndB with AHSA1/START domain